MAKKSRAEQVESMLESMARQRSKAQAKLLRSERAIEKVIAAWQRKSGLDLGALRELNAARRRDFKAVVAERATMLSKAAGISRSGIEARGKAFAAAARRSGFFKLPSFTLDKPVRITGRPFSIVKSKTIKPFKSFVKFRSSRTEEGTDTVKFVYEWPNPFGVTVDIDAITFVAASGVFEMNIHGGFIIHSGTMEAFVEIAAGTKREALAVHETRFLSGSIFPYNHPAFPFDGFDAGASHGEFQLMALRQPIEPKKSAQIEVRLTVLTQCGSDFDCEADFERGLLGVSCPVVVVRVHGVPSVITPGVADAAFK